MEFHSAQNWLVSSQFSKKTIVVNKKVSEKFIETTCTTITCMEIMKSYTHSSIFFPGSYLRS